MPVLEPWIPFALATLAFACMPGPAILYMTAQTLAYGRRAGLMAALGVHLGCYVHIAAAAIGLATLLDQAPGLFTVIRLAGALYLAWLGISMFRSWKAVSDQAGRAQPNVLRDSVVVEILNPKTALFFLTFLPQFVDPAAATPVWLQFLVLGLVVNCAFSLADLASVGLASLSLAKLAAGPAGRLVPKICGSILIALSLALVTHYT
ncbi:LysE family translocator [Labrys neptuniae]